MNLYLEKQQDSITIGHSLKLVNNNNNNKQIYKAPCMATEGCRGAGEGCIGAGI